MYDLFFLLDDDDDGAFIQAITSLQKEMFDSIYYLRITSSFINKFVHVLVCIVLYSFFQWQRHVINLPPCFELEYIIFLLIYS